jgi:hypothetical protein
MLPLLQKLSGLILKSLSYNQPVIRDYGAWNPNYFVTRSLATVLKSFKISEQKLEFDHIAVQN